MKVEIIVPGIPVGKARPRVTRNGTFTPKKTRDYEAQIRECWRKQSGRTIPDGVPVMLTVSAYFPIPKSYPKKRYLQLLGKPHIKLPDLDNCIKIASDGCQGAVFSNDSMIYRIVAGKYYSSEPHMEIILEGNCHEEES